jgi:hypothetical protein
LSVCNEALRLPRLQLHHGFGRHFLLLLQLLGEPQTAAKYGVN